MCFLAILRLFWGGPGNDNFYSHHRIVYMHSESTAAWKLTLSRTLTCHLFQKNRKWKEKKKRCGVCNYTVFNVICQERGQVHHHGFQTPRDRWKHEAIGRLLSFVSRCLEPVMKYEVQFFTSLLKWYNKKANASVWSQIKNMFHRRWKPGDVLSGVSLSIKIHPPDPNGCHLLAFD